MQECCAPGYRSAPIVTRKKDLLLPELVGHRDHVGNELGQRVGGHTAGFAAHIVSALVGHDDAKSGLGEGPDLWCPVGARGGQGMHEDHRDAGATGVVISELDARKIGVALLRQGGGPKGRCCGKKRHRQRGGAQKT